MKMNQIMAVISSLAQSQGFYGRLKRDILYYRDNEPETYSNIVAELEGQNFKDSLDLILYLEC
jgi:hypothetical protein